MVEAKLEGIDLAGQGRRLAWGFVALGKDGGFAASGIFKPGIGQVQSAARCMTRGAFRGGHADESRAHYPRPTPDTAVDRHPEHRRYPYEITFRDAKPKARVIPVEMPEGRAASQRRRFRGPQRQGRCQRLHRPAKRGCSAMPACSDMPAILDRAVVRETATVQDHAEVSGAAVVSGNANVSGDARVRNHAFVANRRKSASVPASAISRK